MRLDYITLELFERMQVDKLCTLLLTANLCLIQIFCAKLDRLILPGGHSEWVPPESIPNSVVKTFCADDSAEDFRVKVGTAGHRIGSFSSASSHFVDAPCIRIILSLHSTDAAYAGS